MRSSVESTVVKIEGLTKSFDGHSVFRDLTLDFPRRRTQTQ